MIGDHCHGSGRVGGDSHAGAGNGKRGIIHIGSTVDQPTGHGKAGDIISAVKPQRTSVDHRRSTVNRNAKTVNCGKFCRRAAINGKQARADTAPAIPFPNRADEFTTIHDGGASVVIQGGKDKGAIAVLSQ